MDDDDGGGGGRRGGGRPDVGNPGASGGRRCRWRRRSPPDPEPDRDPRPPPPPSPSPSPPPRSGRKGPWKTDGSGRGRDETSDRVGGLRGKQMKFGRRPKKPRPPPPGLGPPRPCGGPRRRRGGSGGGCDDLLHLNDLDLSHRRTALLLLMWTMTDRGEEGALGPEPPKPVAPRPRPPPAPRGAPSAPLRGAEGLPGWVVHNSVRHCEGCYSEEYFRLWTKD